MTKLPATIEPSPSAIAKVLPQLRSIAETSNVDTELRSALALAKGMEVTAKELGIAEVHAELSWIRETALRRLARMERPRHTDRGEGGRFDTDVRKTNVGDEPLTGAERTRLSEARSRHADLSDQQFDELKQRSLEDHTPATPRLFKTVEQEPVRPNRLTTVHKALNLLQAGDPDDDVAHMDDDGRSAYSAAGRLIEAFGGAMLRAVERVTGTVVFHERAPDESQTALTLTDESQEAWRLYNETAERCGLPKAQRLTAPRKSKLKRRLHDCGGIEGWKAALAKVEASPHCTGDNDRGWTASLDFMLQESSFTKIMEGTYDDRRRSRVQSQAERVAREMDEMGI